MHELKFYWHGKLTVCVTEAIMKSNSKSLYFCPCRQRHMEIKEKYHLSIAAHALDKSSSDAIALSFHTAGSRSVNESPFFVSWFNSFSCSVTRTPDPQ